MGGGGLRILGHKKWHVWRRENIERVESDEQRYVQQQRQLLVDQRGVEQERRAHALQSTSEGRDRAPGDRDSSAPEHINLFQHEQEEHEKKLSLVVASEAVRGNDKRERERSQHAQSQQETLGRQGHVPWYAKPSSDGDGDVAGGSRTTEAREKKKRKRALEDQDPLKHMRPRRSSSPDARDRQRSRDAEERTERVYKSDFSRLASQTNSSKEAHKTSSSSAPDFTKKQRKKHKKHSKHRHEKESMLQQLRRERQERESRERQRAKALFKGQ